MLQQRSNKKAGHFASVLPATLKRTRNALQGEALCSRLDVAKLNLMLSSDCSQIGTGSSNSPRSASESQV
jgi:hypothetical protein